MRSRRWCSCVLLMVALSGLAPWAAAQDSSQPTEPQGPSLAEAEEQVRMIRAALKEHPSPESWGMLMMAETILLSVRAQQAAGGGPVDEAALDAERRRMQERIYAEWKTAQPDDPTPYLAEIQGRVPPERMDDAVLDLLPRFPDNARLLGRALPILSRREQGQRATELVEGALERHPERSDLYPVAIGWYRGLSNESRQRELAEAWIERLPGDPNALRHWLGQPPSRRDPRESAARVERFVTAGGADGPRTGACGWLLRADNGAYRDAAVRCLTAIAEQAKDSQVRAQAAGFLGSAAGASGDEQGLACTLAELPAERRPEAVLNAVHALGEGQCDRKMELLRLLPWDGSKGGGRAVDRFSALHGCETHRPSRVAYVEAFARVPAEDLSGLLNRWFMKVNGRYLEDYGLAPHIVAALEERLRRQGDQIGVWQALSAAYELAGWEDRRAAHLRTWIAGDRTLPDRSDLIWLADYLAGHEGPGAGIEVLRRGWRETHNLEIAAALADLLLMAEKMDDFQSLVDDLAGTEPAAGAPAGERSLALLLRARAALLSEDPKAALADYQAYVETAPYLKAEEATEYLLIVAGVRGTQAAEEAAQTVCARESLFPATTPAQCAARLLGDLGHAPGALQLLQAAAQRSPEDLGLQLSLALAADQAGELDLAEQAYRRMVALDPKSEAGWAGLGHIAEHHGDPAEIEAVLRQAERARGDRPIETEIALARAYRKRGQAARAIEVLTALRERHPGIYPGEEELRLAYEALAREAPSSQAIPAASGPLPSADDLRAVREAEAALLGVGGTVDEAKAREIVIALAQRGNVYANVRLAIWQQAGRQGFEANPRQAAATAAPYLPSLRAAAESGEPFAQYLWGTILLNGAGVPRQATEAHFWLVKAAERNEPWALYNLGYMAEHGEGVALDLEEALRWYQRGAEVGNPDSMKSLAELRLDSDPAFNKPEEGVQWLARAAEKGLPSAVSWYAALLLYGLPGVPSDPVRARPWLEKAAAIGEIRGIYDLAAALLTGAGGAADEPRAVTLLEQAAERGNARAMWQLVWQSALGRGTPRDGNRAGQWIEHAAARGFDEPGFLLGSSEEQIEPARRYFARGLRELEQLAAAGDAFAGGLLARLHSGGVGVKGDGPRAVAYARPAAAAGSTEAMRVLGWAYRQGDGVEQDAAQAAAWWRRGAEAGSSFCMMWYSQMLFRGEGGKKDPAAALTWLERSGERGNAWAIRDLGHLYDEGWYDLPRDEKKAAYWKRKALAFDDQEARGWLIARRLLE